MDFTAGDPKKKSDRWAGTPPPPLPPPLPVTIGDRNIGDRQEPIIGDRPPAVETATTGTAACSLIEIKQAEKEDHKDTRGILASFTVHTIELIILAYVFVPMQNSRPGISLSMRAGDENSDSDFDDSTFTIDAASSIDDEQSAASFVSIEAVSPSVELQAPIATPTTRSGGTKDVDGAKQGGGGRAGGDGTSGSFFGLYAPGKDFVYVLDVSGSMTGQRYKRASAELVRSTQALSSNQRFYVNLFSSDETRMFGDTRSNPEPVVASNENVARLKNWLASSSCIGSTRPAAAVRTALKMKPSAIFMLSDGEFDPKDYTLKIVKNSRKKVPVHAIAFESMASLSNMKAIANLSGGNFHFENTRDGSQASAELTELLAKRAFIPEAKFNARLKEIAGFFPKTSAGSTAQGLLTKSFEQRSIKAVENGDPDLLCAAIDKILDAAPTIPAERAAVVEQASTGIRALMKDATARPELRERAYRIAQFFPDQPAATGLGRFLASDALREADRFVQQGKPAEALKLLEIEKSFAVSPSIKKRHEASLRAIRDKVLREVSGVLQQKDTIEKLDGLIPLHQKFAGTRLGEEIRGHIVSLARELLASQQFAKLQKDRARDRECQAIIDQYFASSMPRNSQSKSGEAELQNVTRNEILSQAKKSLREMNSESSWMLARAKRYERRNQFDDAGPVYHDLQTDFPGSLGDITARNFFLYHPAAPRETYHPWDPKPPEVLAVEDVPEDELLRVLGSQLD